MDPEVFHDVARNLADLVEDAAVWGSHECHCGHPSVGSVNVDAAGLAVLANDEAGEEQADEDCHNVCEPDAVEHGGDHDDGKLENAFK